MRTIFILTFSLISFYAQALTCIPLQEFDHFLCNGTTGLEAFSPRPKLAQIQRKPTRGGSLTLVKMGTLENGVTYSECWSLVDSKSDQFFLICKSSNSLPGVIPKEIRALL